MATTTDRPNTIPWPPIVLAATLVAGIVLGIFIPIGWPSGTGADILQAAGILFVLTAFALYASSAREMKRAKTTILPHRGADRLVTSGPYRLSRNPIYLANVILLCGLGLIFGNGWMFAAAAISGFAEQKLAIEREEAHLEHRFGKTWRDYKKRVRRWI